jgi:citrate lyase beta subunit
MTLSGSAPANRVFTPGEAEVALAGRVIAPFAETETAGSARRLQREDDETRIP